MINTCKQEGGTSCWIGGIRNIDNPNEWIFKNKNNDITFQMSGNYIENIYTYGIPLWARKPNNMYEPDNHKYGNEVIFCLCYGLIHTYIMFFNIYIYIG